MNFKILTLFLLFSTTITAQDSLFIKVHFLYGSTPKKAYKATEKKWFGGKLGGHVGIEYDSNQIIDFGPQGKFHIFSKQKNKHSQFALHTVDNFWTVFGNNGEDVKKASFVIPISIKQKQKLDSIARQYLLETPYDYAFIGMRCAAATYDILGQLSIVKPYARPKIIRKIFYPKKLRKRVFVKAREKGWQVFQQEGSTKRNWETD